MDSGVPIRKRGTSRLVVGVPQGQEENISARIETSDGDVIVLREATLAALVQAYMDVFTHPTTNALELEAAATPSSEAGPGNYQLVPGNTSEEQLRRELAGTPPQGAFGEEDDETQVRWNSMPYPTGDGQRDPDGSSGGLSTRTMEQIDESTMGAGLGWQTRDDGPIFGDIPTQHSSPSTEGPSGAAADTDSDALAPTGKLD